MSCSIGGVGGAKFPFAVTPEAVVGVVGAAADVDVEVEADVDVEVVAGTAVVVVGAGLEADVELGAVESTEKLVPVVTVTSAPSAVFPYSMITDPDSDRATSWAAASSTGVRWA